MKQILITIVKFALSLGILGYLFYCAWQNDQFQTLAETEKNWVWLAVALMATLAAHLVSYFRWRFMVTALDIPFSFSDATKIGFIGSFFNLFAFGVVGGDSLRAFYVGRQFKHRIPEVIASVIADRAIGMLTMFTFASVAFLFMDFGDLGDSNSSQFASMRIGCQVIVSLTVIGYVGLFALLLTPNLKRTSWFKKMTSLPRIGALAKRLTAVVLMYRNRFHAIVKCFALSMVVNICFVVSIFAIAAGISENHPTFANHFLIAPISMTANAVPLPGGLGGMELMLDFLYKSLADEGTDSPGIVIAFAFRFALLMVSAIGGVFWFTHRKTLDEITQEHSNSLT